ncbi:chemotaxis protein CheX [Noviherbaspirillum sp. CPCC 100848]|uniref:Chemotaxis protein CheX n=1 Tax=Noviherbaspirillum album TaxID=3080276 RepID=A0ABU6JC87_9BURK|nr:chemotaxis protein CheX [Noviherbaspirillum sp. CPCC 100848]MEC4721155.1 chemotaxis protein CheX [Noviherbaspirillum sp. CPCC 100848]
MFQLTELQHDALVEIFNIGVGQAAAAMSRIVNEEVTMSVPHIAFQSRAEVAHTLGSTEGRRICAIAQQFNGAFDTEAFLMFPEEKSLEIVRLMVGQSLSLEELSEMEQEAMSEIGNIILNSCMATLANASGKELQGSLPMYHVGTGNDILSQSGKQWDGVVLTLKIDFNIERHHIYGYVAFLLDLPALHDLTQYIDSYLAGVAG